MPKITLWRLLNELVNKKEMLFVLLSLLWWKPWEFFFGFPIFLLRDGNQPRQVLILAHTGGAGKTTVAKALAQKHGLLYISLDDLKYGPGWARSTDEFLRLFHDKMEEARETGYVIDGLLDDPKLPAHKDLLSQLIGDGQHRVVFLCVPRWVCMWRILWRSVGRRLGWVAQGSAPETLKDVWAMLNKVWYSSSCSTEISKAAQIVYWPYFPRV